MNRILDPIISACQFVEAKREKQKAGQQQKGCRISCSVKWADWNQKIFGPAFAIYWQAEAPSGNLHFNGDPIKIVADKLNVSSVWVLSLIDFYSAKNELETKVIINLNSKIIHTNKFQEILVEEWTNDGISSFEVAEELRRSYALYQEPTWLPNHKKITDLEVKRNLATKLIRDASYYEFNFI